MMICRGQLILMMDADGATRVSDVEKLEAALEKVAVKGAPRRTFFLSSRLGCAGKSGCQRRTPQVAVPPLVDPPGPCELCAFEGKPPPGSAAEVCGQDFPWTWSSVQETMARFKSAGCTGVHLVACPKQ